MDKGAIEILKKHGCLYMKDDYAELFEELENYYTDSPDPELVEILKSDMTLFGFELTDEQVIEYIKDERVTHSYKEDFVKYLAIKIVGREYPLYGDSKEYKEEFYRTMGLKSKEMGYKWVQ